MDSLPHLPDDLAACWELIGQLQTENAKQQHAFEKQQHALDQQQRKFDEQQRVLEDVDASYQELQQERDLLKAELEAFRRWLYGRRTERIVASKDQQPGTNDQENHRDPGKHQRGAELDRSKIEKLIVRREFHLNPLLGRKTPVCQNTK